MPHSDENKKTHDANSQCTRQGWIARGFWRIANYYCPLQEGRFAPDLLQIFVEGFPEGIYRSLIPTSVLSSLAELAHHGWLLPVLELPTKGLSFLFAALGGVMLGSYLGARL